MDSLRPTHFNSPTGNIKAPKPGDWPMTTKEVAKMVRKSERTITDMASNAKLPGFKVGRPWRFWYSEIIEFLERNRGENLLGI